MRENFMRHGMRDDVHAFLIGCLFCQFGKAGELVFRILGHALRARTYEPPALWVSYQGTHFKKHSDCGACGHIPCDASHNRQLLDLVERDGGGGYAPDLGLHSYPRRLAEARPPTLAHGAAHGCVSH